MGGAIMKGWKGEWIKRARSIIIRLSKGEAYYTQADVDALLAEYEAHRAEKRREKEAPWTGEVFKAEGTPLSDEYLALWVPRMEEIVAYFGNVNNFHNDAPCAKKWTCSECLALRSPCNKNASAFLSRPDVVAWKERQNEWPKWITISAPQSPSGRRVLACYSQADMDGFVSARLATAAEIDAIGRG
jgi:hypothetical protein